MRGGGGGGGDMQKCKMCIKSQFFGFGLVWFVCLLLFFWEGGGGEGSNRITLQDCKISHYLSCLFEGCYKSALKDYCIKCAYLFFFFFFFLGGGGVQVDHIK